ncbi:uncharacterized protein LOC105838526 [Monomorium pharaonis]|uniref:uncharacterized protein LOC105838526 n=1 Tax=Monomorium pharaonis TaxID=307658 RepID=UPI00102E10A9|nr:uncharacterized protein LOC105838526 [Monomorium pharaonis]
MAVQTMVLNNGIKIPILGLGTWQAGDDPKSVEQAVNDAVDAGYRHFDCAYIYQNEKEIGKVLCEKIAKGVVKREDLFITTKLWNTFHKQGAVVPACRRSLKNFGLDYVDLYLIHWPISYAENADGIIPVDENGDPMFGHEDFLDTWRGMEECVRLGLTRSIGLSNFNSEQIDRVLSIAQIKPVMNQVECHPNLNQKKLRDFCASRGIAVTAYSPFGSPKRIWAKPGDPKVILDEPEIVNIGTKYGKTPAQVILRYLIDIGTIPIPKSSSKKRIKQNIDIFDFKLTPEEITIIDKFDCGGRVLPLEELRPLCCNRHFLLLAPTCRIIMVNIPIITFSNGFKMPSLGLGTYKSQMGNVKKAVKDAIELGYRHIDTASFYDNEKEIGEAIREVIKDGKVAREDLFITTKLWNNCHKEELVVPACKQSLANLGLDYVDLYLVHWPFAFKEGDDRLPTDAAGNLVESDTDYLETWRGMEECIFEGLTRSIGISNFNSEQITRLLESAKIQPVNNQIEVNINVNQEKLVDFCKKHDITVTAYSPLGQPGNSSGIDNKLDNPVILEFAKKYNKTPAQVALRYVYQQGTVPIPKSVTKSRIKENMEIFDFTLTSDEMDAIRKLGTGERVAYFLAAKDFKYFPFNIPF